MQTNRQPLHYAFAALAFLVSLVTYLLTVQPSVPFWDCGEFTAAAVGQQVPHPPGAPLFLMVGKLFHLLPFGDPGWRVNLVSVFASAITVLLLYLITVRVVKNFFTMEEGSVGDQLLVYGSGLVAALTFTFTDTFWFNAVESEVYAASSLFVALIVWIMMLWNEKADEQGSERYLLLIAYLIGLSIGVHLLSILTVFSLVLLVYLRKYQFKTSTLLLTLGIGIAVFVVTYTLIIMKLPAMLAGYLPFKTEAEEFVAKSDFYIVLAAILIGLVGWLVWYGRKNNRPMLAMWSSAIILLLIGYTTYGHILVRANSNPPMNENKPENFTKLEQYLGRDQYGKAPGWPRRYQTEQRFVEKYREYGEWNPGDPKIVTRKDGTQIYVPDYRNWNNPTAGELGYLFDYQISHMYLRYFMWNFSGRVSDVQDAPSVSLFANKNTVRMWNADNGYASLFPINFWMIPFLLGVIGLIIHFIRDPKMAWVYLVLFLMTGVLAAIQQNQQSPQPRERDYFYVSSFMVYAMWVGMGFFGLVSKFRNNTAIISGGLLASLLLAPVNMAAQGWKIHSREGNYLAFDYAYNILQSCEKNAIVFTNGDNDTFPVWYLQDVAGIRQDVRVVNLSLGQTNWYVEQLKNREPHGAAKIPLSFTDESLLVDENDPKALSYTMGPAKIVTVPVSPEILRQYTSDTAIINRGVMQWNYTGMPRGGEGQYLYGVQHQLVYDIIKQTRFTRPLYFSTSAGMPGRTHEFIGLDGHLRAEGMCYRICPAPQSSAVGEGFNREVMEKSLMQSKDGDEVSSTPSYGLKFRNLNNPAVYYDDVHRGYIANYRNIFLRYAYWLLYDQKDSVRANQVMLRMNQLISLDLFIPDPAMEFQLARFFQSCGNEKEAEKMALRTLARVEDRLANPISPDGLDAAQQSQELHMLAVESSKILGKWEISKKHIADLGGVGPQIDFMIAEIDVLKLMRAKNFSGALQLAYSLQSKFPANTQDRAMQAASRDLQQLIMELETKTGTRRAPQAMIVGDTTAAN